MTGTISPNSTLHVHLDHENCMEVTVLKGRGADVQQFADRIISERGVRHGHVVYLPADGAHSHDGGTAHSHAHEHGHTHSHVRSHGHTHSPRRRKTS
jgi:CopG family nickel-responsive transcriptional regulator